MSSYQDIQNVNGIKNYVGVILKATEGTTYTDPSFMWKYNFLKSNNIKVGAYHFLRDTSSPETQAEHFYNTLRELDIDFIPVLDVEETNGIKGMLATEYSIRFLNRFKELSTLDCIIYGSSSFISVHISSIIKQKYKFWIAHYGVDKPWIPTGCNCIAWQYTDSATLEGVISNRIDKSIVYDLDSWMLNKEVQAPPTPQPIEVAQSGSATVIVDGLQVRTEPNLSSEVVATYNNGERIYNYVAYIDCDGYRWIKYKGRSGYWRYVASRRLSDNKRYLNCY